MSEIKVGDFKRIKPYVFNGTTYLTVEIIEVNNDKQKAKVKLATGIQEERWVAFEELFDIEPFEENPQEMLDALLLTLRKCSCAGDVRYNDLVKLEYIKENNEEYVRPIFRNGVGKNGYYDVCVSGDSNKGMLIDVVDRFVRKMW